MPFALLMAAVLASLTVAGISVIHSAPVVIAEPDARIFPEISSAGLIAAIGLVLIAIWLWRKIHAYFADRNPSDRDRMF